MICSILAEATLIFLLHAARLVSNPPWAAVNNMVDGAKQKICVVAKLRGLRQ
jgi:hypothetical protein